jgi:hypothetical protein
MNDMLRTMSVAILFAASACGAPDEPCKPLTPPRLADFVGTYSLTTVDGVALPYTLSLGSVNGATVFQSGSLIVRADSTIQFSQTGSYLSASGTVTPSQAVHTGKWAAGTCGAITFSDSTNFSSIKTDVGILEWSGAEIVRGGAYASQGPYRPRFEVTRVP